MTGITEFVPLGLQQTAAAGSVRIVAGGTFPFFEGFMLFRTVSHQVALIVTLKAKGAAAFSGAEGL